MKQKVLKFFAIILILNVLAACGNPNQDESTENTTGTTTTNTTSSTATSTASESGYFIRLSLVKATDSLPITTISSSSPGKLVASISNEKGESINNILITFASDFAFFSPSSATALTDSNGQANILLIPGELAGAGSVAASFNFEEQEISTQLNFSVASSQATSSNSLAVTLNDANGTATTVIRADLPGVITATLTDENTAGIPGVVIKVQGTLASFRPENGTVVTDSNGIASIQLLAGEKTGADTLTLTATTTNEILTSLLVYQVNPPALQIGNFTNGTFVANVLGISNVLLAASATTSVTVDILDANGNPFNTPVEVEFTSNCVIARTSSIDEIVTSINGQAIATYEAKGCQGNDIITAKVNYSGAVFTVTGSVTIAADSAGFIEFLSASPKFIAISGTGGAGLSETSIVTFRVLSKLGSPLPNQLINFGLNTSVGGISVTPASKTTNAAGEVTTTVQSGRVATSVRVTASVDSTTISAQSDQLIISTGVPDQNSVSLSLSNQNPEAFSFDGEEVIVTARLADRFNNPVPDGTAVYFTAEGGSIEPGCNTENGACNVTWTSQEPRPIDHRATIMVIAVGDESFTDEDGNGFYNDNDGEPYNDSGNGVFDEAFTDTNGNNIFDEPFIDANTSGTYNFGETFIDYNSNGRYDGVGNNSAGELTFIDANANGLYDGSGTVVTGDAFTDVSGNGNFDAPGFSDLPEAYLDNNENNQRDNGELFLDFNNNGQHDLRDEAYNGVLCSHTSICSTNRSIHVRQSSVLVMSGSAAFVVIQDRDTGEIYGSNHPSVSTTAALDVSGGGQARLQIFIMDSAGQVMAKGTGISLTADVGEMTGQLDFTVGSTISKGGHLLSATIIDDDAAIGDGGIISVEVTTPKQHVTILNINISV